MGDIVVDIRSPMHTKQHLVPNAPESRGTLLDHPILVENNVYNYSGDNKKLRNVSFSKCELLAKYVHNNPRQRVVLFVGMLAVDQPRGLK
jgi:hypothetical protein